MPNVITFIDGIGFDKFDILSQRGIGHIDDTVKFIEKNKGVKVDIRDTEAIFSIRRFTGSLKQYPVLGGGCYLLQGNVEVDYHFPTITISKMAKMPFIPDPRYADGDEDQRKAQERLREDVSMTDRAPISAGTGDQFTATQNEKRLNLYDD